MNQLEKALLIAVVPLTLGGCAAGNQYDPGHTATKECYETRADQTPEGMFPLDGKQFRFLTADPDNPDDYRHRQSVDLGIGPNLCFVRGRLDLEGDQIVSYFVADNGCDGVDPKTDAYWISRTVKVPVMGEDFDGSPKEIGYDVKKLEEIEHGRADLPPRSPTQKELDLVDALLGVRYQRFIDKLRRQEQERGSERMSWIWDEMQLAKECILHPYGSKRDDPMPSYCRQEYFEADERFRKEEDRRGEMREKRKRKDRHRGRLDRLMRGRSRR